MKRTRLVLTALWVTIWASPSLAAQLSTGPVVGRASGVTCVCSVVNTSPKTALDVVVDILDADGDVVDTSNQAIPPLQTGSNVDNDCGSSNPHWCRVTGRFPKKKVRGNYCVIDNVDFTSTVCSALQ